jgi:hypothetical protein
VLAEIGSRLIGEAAGSLQFPEREINQGELVLDGRRLDRQIRRLNAAGTACRPNRGFVVSSSR